MCVRIGEAGGGGGGGGGLWWASIGKSALLLKLLVSKVKKIQREITR